MPDQKHKYDLSTQKYKTHQPDFQVSAADKIVLGVAEHSENKFHFVYILACNPEPTKVNTYDALAEMNVATFTNKLRANMYAATMRQVMKYQQGTLPQFYHAFQQFNNEKIKQFRQWVIGAQQGR